MAGLGYREVTITIDGTRVVCTPDHAELFWVEGPDKVRWIYPAIPKKITKLVIEWETPERKPCMYIRSQSSDSLPGRRALVTVGNLRTEGIFKYKVSAFDRNGNIVASCDPEVENQPTPPGN